MKLAAEKCVPCVKGEGKLDIREAEDMLNDLDNWVIEGNSIVRRLKFKHFQAALDWVNRVGVIAEEEGHHPDITFGWGYAEIRLTTHDAEGLTRNDYILAAKIDKIR